MLESFRITAYKIHRKLTVVLYLPDEYYKTEKEYPLVIAFEGDKLFTTIGEEDKREFHMDDDIKLKHLGNVIVAGIFSPTKNNPEWNISELNPYYNGNLESVDTSYSSSFNDYVTHELLSTLKQKYRFNINDIYLLGIKESGIGALSMVQNKEFKGAMIFNPNLSDCNNKVFDDIDDKLDISKKIYLYQGEKDSSDKEGELFYKLQSKLEKKLEYFVLDYDMDSDNTYKSIENHLDTAFKIIKG